MAPGAVDGDVDDPVLASVRQGHPDWAALFQQHFATMYAAAQSVLKGQTAVGVDADDVVIVVMSEVITEGIPTDVERLHTYLAAIARRRAVDAVRRRKHQTDDPLDVDTLQRRTTALPDSPEAVVIRSELTAEIVHHLAELPYRERFALEQSVCASTRGKRSPVRSE
jgi:RNA polymerase sigma factor (sigma-70 family)